MNKTLLELRKELIASSDEKTRTSGERYFKEKIILYGIKSAILKNISKQYYKSLGDTGKQRIFELCCELWESGILEESFVACDWSYNVHKQYTPDDINQFEKWVFESVNNWAICDTLCNHSVGTLIEMYPELINRLKKWANSDNRWVKRAAAVSLIIPARHGKFLKDIVEIADILHSDSDDMVQKGYGWMLKAASQAHQKEIFEYVVSRKSTMPRTSLRYAIEKMPAELKAVAMAK